jgi:hypothetical protein
MHYNIDISIIGKRFRKLVVLSYEYSKKTSPKKSNAYFKCQCDCGKTAIVMGNDLKTGNTGSCGCLIKENMHTLTHGDSNNKLYWRYKHMISRCENPKDISYKNYGGRGIKVCEEWHKYEIFRDWSLSSGYSEKLSLDRIDNDGNYEPSNCRWTTPYIQTRNKRTTRNITVDGITMCIVDWARYLNVPRKTISRKTDEEFIVNQIKKYKNAKENTLLYNK